ncbi:hypothetical protein JCM15765_27800 [Paradesulfitobacterium aromaticivorans]
MPKVCLDAGHNDSGADTGAQGNGLLEQNITLDIVLRIRRKLEQRSFEVVLTREGPFVNGAHGTLSESLRTRCQIANAAKADLFVSVHVNAGGGTGVEVHALASGGKAEECARKVLPYLVDAGNWASRGVKFSNFQVLRETVMPAILTENGFIDTKEDAEKLKNSNIIEAIADAHVHGICDFFGIAYTPAPVASETIAQTSVIDALIVFIGYPEAGIVPRLQAHLKAPSIMLKDLTWNTVLAASKVYGVGYQPDDYKIDGKQIPLHDLISGNDGDDTALEVIKYIKAGRR